PRHGRRGFSNDLVACRREAMLKSVPTIRTSNGRAVAASLQHDGPGHRGRRLYRINATLTRTPFPASRLKILMLVTRTVVGACYTNTTNLADDCVIFNVPRRDRR